MKFLIETLFRSVEISSATPDKEHLLQVATATLLLEVIRADFEVQQSELDKLYGLLGSQFQLDKGELDQIVSEANEEADHLVSLQHITRQLNEAFSEAEKVRVIEMMWESGFRRWQSGSLRRTFDPTGCRITLSTALGVYKSSAQGRASGDVVS